LGGGGEGEEGEAAEHDRSAHLGFSVLSFRMIWE
jgi:hypothetical protein